MSNDLILSIKNTLAKVGVDEETRAVAGKGGGGGSKRISIKGGVFPQVRGWQGGCLCRGSSHERDLRQDGSGPEPHVLHGRVQGRREGLSGLLVKQL